MDTNKDGGQQPNGLSSSEHRAKLLTKLNCLVAVSRDRGYEQDAWRMCKPLPRRERRPEKTRSGTGARSRR